MTRVASGLLLAATLCVVASAGAQQAPAATAMKKTFLMLEIGMMREQVSKLASSQGPMDLKQEIWGRWVPGAKAGEMEVLRVHFFDNRVYWIEYDAFADSWWREEKGSCADWVKMPFKRLQDTLKTK